MKIKVRFFASCREAAGKERVDLQVPAGETVSELLKIVRQDFPNLSLNSIMVAVNQEFINQNYTLHEGDEVALIPPVSGG